MATSIGSAAEVRRILRRSSDDLTDTEVEAYINEAIREIKAENYNLYMFDSFVTTSNINSGNTNLVYGTYFDMSSSASHNPSVYVNSSLKTLTTDYTVDKSTSLITFTSTVDLGNGDIIGIYYMPDWFDDYANWTASLLMLETSSIDIPDSEGQSSVYDRVKNRVDKYRKRIQNKPHVATWVDHKEDGSIF